MSFDFATAKATVRRVVQDTLGVPAFYTDNSLNAPVELRARWHNKIGKVGELHRGEGYAEIVENIERIILIPEIWITDELTGVSTKTGDRIVLKRNGQIHFPSSDATFIVGYEEPSTGPLEEAWSVTRA